MAKYEATHQRKKLGEELRLSEERYSHLFENAPVGIMLFNRDATILSVNSEVKRITGYNKGEMVGKRFREISGLMTESSMALTKDRFRRLLLGEEFGSLELEITTKAGKRTIIEVTHSSVTTGGDVMVIVRDVTERRKALWALKGSETKTRAILGAIPDMMFQLGEDGTFLDFKPSKTLRSAMPPSKFLRKKIQDVMPEEFANLVMRHVKKALQTGKTQRFEYQLPVQLKGGTPSDYEARIVVIGKTSVLAMVRDVTEQKKAAEMLKESEDKYRSLVENIPDVVWTTDSQGKTYFISPNIRDMVGYTPKDYYQSGEEIWHRRIHPDDAERVLKAFEQLFTQNRKYDIEYRLQTKDGRWIWTHERAMKTYEEDGILYAHGVSSDITEMKKAQEKIKLFSKAIAGASDAIVLTDMDGTITHANPATEEIYGYKKGELIGKPLLDLDPKPKMMKDIISALKKKGSWDGEVWQKKKNKETFPALLALSTVKDEKGKPIAMMADVRDYTELKREERELKVFSNAISTSTNAICINDLDGGFTYANPAFERMFGYSLKELTKMTMPQLAPKEGLRRLTEMILPAIRKKGGWAGEQKGLKKDGTKFPLSLSASLVKDKNGIPIAMLGSFIDLTEQKQAEEALREHEELLLLQQYNENIMRNLPSAVALCNRELMIESANHAFYKWFKKSENIIGKSVYEAFPPRLLHLLKMGRKIRMVFKTRKRSQDINVESPGGKRIWNIRYIPTLQRGRRLSQVMVIFDDVTQTMRLKQKVAKLTRRIPLTEREKLTFYGLVEYPLLTDLQLSKKLGLKRTTVTAIRNKLLRQNFYTPQFIPNFAALGCELLCVLDCPLPKEPPKKRRMPTALADYSGAVLAFGTDKEFFSLIIAEHFAEAKKLYDAVASKYEVSELERPHMYYYPSLTDEISVRVSFSQPLKHLFGIELKQEKQKELQCTGRSLTRNEKRVLYALTKFPDLIDKRLAWKVGLSRVTVGRIRKMLLEENFLQRVNVPNLQRLGFELMTLSHSKGKCAAGTLAPVILSISGGSESSHVSVYTNYTQYKAMLKERGEQPQREIVFPMASITSSKSDFAQLVKKVLELDVDF